MSIVKTFTMVTLMALGLAKPAAALGDLHIVFAGCVGRFSAEMEHAWLMGDTAAATFASQRKSFLSLMEATMPPDAGRNVLMHRLDHKFAHASLLSLATFGADKRRAHAARSAAKAHRLACEGLLLRS